MEALWQIALDRTLLTFGFAEHLLMGFSFVLLWTHYAHDLTPKEGESGTGKGMDQRKLVFLSPKDWP